LIKTFVQELSRFSWTNVLINFVVEEI